MDKIRVEGIEFYAYHGVLKSEKELGQIFSVDCEFTIDAVCCSDDLNNTVNYADVTCEIVSFCKNTEYDLIETLTNELAKDVLLKFPLIKEITLTLHKPHAPIPAHFSDVSLTVTRAWHDCYLGIGSNLGQREKNLDLVWNEICKNPYMQPVCRSEYIETKPYGVVDQPDFLNGAIKIRTILTPRELLRFCGDTETICGRVRTRHWGERTLDVDILMYDDLVIYTDELKLPHPEMHMRDFVLQPLAQIEPYLIHPIKKMNVMELLKSIKKQGEE